MRWFRLALAVGLALMPSLGGAALSGQWTVRGGSIAYEVRHLLHGALGRSRDVQGSVRCEGKACTFHFSVALAGFESGNAERDGEMRRAVGAERHPLAEVEGSGRLVDDHEAVVTGTVRLAGESVPLPLTRFRVEQGWWRLRLRGSFPISQAALGIEPPALLGVPIADAVWIYVELELGSA